MRITFKTDSFVVDSWSGQVPDHSLLVSQNDLVPAVETTNNGFHRNGLHFPDDTSLQLSGRRSTTRLRATLPGCSGEFTRLLPVELSPHECAAQPLSQALFVLKLRCV